MPVFVEHAGNGRKTNAASPCGSQTLTETYGAAWVGRCRLSLGFTAVSIQIQMSASRMIQAVARAPCRAKRTEGIGGASLVGLGPAEPINVCVRAPGLRAYAASRRARGAIGR